MRKRIHTRMILHRHRHINKIWNLILRQYPLRKFRRLLQISTHDRNIPVTIALLHHKGTNLFCNAGQLLCRRIIRRNRNRLFLVFPDTVRIAEQILLQMCQRMSLAPPFTAILS